MRALLCEGKVGRGATTIQQDGPKGGKVEFGRVSMML